MTDASRLVVVLANSPQTSAATFAWSIDISRLAELTI